LHYATDKKLKIHYRISQERL